MFMVGLVDLAPEYIFQLMFSEGVRVAGDAAEVLMGINRPFSGSDMPGFMVVRCSVLL